MSRGRNEPSKTALKDKEETATGEGESHRLQIKNVFGESNLGLSLKYERILGSETNIERISTPRRARHGLGEKNGGSSF